MSKRTVSTPHAPKAIGPYSQAVIHNGIAYLSGQIPSDPATGELVTGEIRQQTARVLENLKAVLEACGSSLDQVLKTTVFLQDMNQFPEMNAVYETFFASNPPARATVEVARLPKNVLVEIDAIAAIS